MNIDNTSNCINKLEFNIIQEILSTFCTNAIAKQMALNLKPNNTPYIINESLKETSEACDLIKRSGEPSFFKLADVTSFLNLLKEDSILSIKSIVNLSNVFKLANNLKSYFFVEYIDSSNFPILSELFLKLYSNQSILSEVSNCISNEVLIIDSASTKLYNIRNEIRISERKIKDTLNKLMHSRYLF